MRELKQLLRDRRRRQRGSVLSAILIIVAFLSILIGGLLTELTGSFMVSRDLVTRVKTEATVTSVAELGIHQLQAGPVPPVCTHDARGPWSLTLNGQAAIVTQTCSAILPEQSSSLGAGSYNVDGVQDTLAGRNRYLVTNAAGRLVSYPFGQTSPSWSIALGATPTAPLLTALDPDGSVNILVAATKNTAGCGGHCVVAFNERGAGAPTFNCDLAATGTVNTRPGAEVTAGGSPNFPGYVFFGDSSHLYAYDASSGGSCPQLDVAALGGRVAGAPLVFPGQASGNTTSDEIFVLVTSSTGTSLQHWRYTETKNDAGNGEGNGNKKTLSLSQVGNSLALGGANAVGYGINSTRPTSGTTLSLAVATPGRLEVARIAVGSSGSSYTMSIGPSAVLPSGALTTRAPYWCPSPCGLAGQALIGVGASVGTTNGFLYLFNAGLTSTLYRYNVHTAVNTTPMADANGDWYFGANDGSVYDVEIPMPTSPTPSLLSLAATFGPGSVVASSPIVGACTGGPCLYFGSTTAGAYFVRIGSTRVSGLRACVSSSPCSPTSAVKPQLWALVQVGPGAVWGGTGVYVQGWSYYSP
jgi:hypothetical protein